MEMDSAIAASPVARGCSNPTGNQQKRSSQGSPRALKGCGAVFGFVAKNKTPPGGPEGDKSFGWEGRSATQA